MSTTLDLDRLVEDYLRRLDAALSGLASSRRLELIDDVRAHIAEGRSRLDDPTESDIRTLLDRLGTPEEIADASLAPGTTTAARPPRLVGAGAARTMPSGLPVAPQPRIDDRRYVAIGTVSGIVALVALVGGGLYGQVHGFLTWQRSLAWVCALLVLVFGLLATVNLSLASIRAAARSVPATALTRRYAVVGIVSGVVGLGVLGAWSLDGHAIGSLVQRVLWWSCPIGLLVFGLLAACCLCLASMRAAARSARVPAIADGAAVGAAGIVFTALAILFVLHVV